MSWPAFSRRWHRRISVVIGVQLFLWTLSGFVFTWDPIEEVRGEHLVRPLPTAPELPAGVVLPEVVESNMQLVYLRDRWVWKGPHRHLVDALTGERVTELKLAEAAAVAKERFAGVGTVKATVPLRIHGAGGREYQGPVPAWRVDFTAEDNPSLYIDARTGDVSGVRTDIWRRFDWFWMLHIMDYKDRENFSSNLLRVAAFLGVTSSITGLMLAWAVYRPNRKPKRVVTG